MILDLDLGNSSISWLLSHHKHETMGSCHNFASLIQEVKTATKDLSASADKMQMIRVACVIQNCSRRDDLIQKITRHWQVTPLMAKPAKKHAGLTTNYDDPNQLGVDRWLALLELSKRGPKDAWLAVDAGTAITADLLVDSVHIGGMIIPGSQLMADAFYQKTHLSKPSQTSQKYQPKKAEATQNWATNTNSCLSSGADIAVMAFGKCLIDNFYQDYPCGKVIISGGGGKQFQQKFKKHYDTRIFGYESHLVCRGLAHCFQSEI